jgi:hypothetical protein
MERQKILLEAWMIRKKFFSRTFARSLIPILLHKLELVVCLWKGPAGIN